MNSSTETNAQRISELVTAYRILLNEQVLDSFGHVSVRSVADPGRFLMPRAMPPALVTSDDVLEYRVADSQPTDQRGRRVNGERYLHGEIYKARPDTQAVIHSHSQAVIPFSLIGVPLRPVIAQAGFMPPAVPNFEVREGRSNGERGMQITDARRGAALAATLGSGPVALLRGHGNVVVRSSVTTRPVQRSTAVSSDWLTPSRSPERRLLRPAPIPTPPAPPPWREASGFLPAAAPR